MMESPGLEEVSERCEKHFQIRKTKKSKAIDTTIKDKTNLFRLEKKTKKIKDKILRDIRNFFRLKKENEVLKDIIFRDIRHLFDHEEKNYYKPARVSNFWSNNYVEYESKGDRNKTLSVNEYLNRIRTYLKDTINNLKKSDTWKTLLIIAINFISSKDREEECVVHSESDNIEITINGRVNKVLKKRFKLLKNRHQNNLEQMKGSEFVFDYVHLLLL